MPHGLGESAPDVSWRDGHGASHLSTSERRSWIASTVSLVRVCAGGHECGELGGRHGDPERHELAIRDVNIAVAIWLPADMTHGESPSEERM